MKIFICHHKKSTLLSSDIFVPIQVGRVINPKIDKMLGDDTAENMSDQNSLFAELTAIYWVWKNYSALGNPEHVGFMHYRRHLSFATQKGENEWGVISRNVMDGVYIENFGLSDTTVRDYVKKYDLIAPKPYSSDNILFNNNYNQYINTDFLNKSDYDTMMQVLQEKYPDYADVAKRYNQAKSGYFNNIFIMKRKLFFKYCDWIFDILFETQKRTIIKDRLNDRYLGHLSERLTGMFITKYKNSVKFAELARTFIEDTDFMPNADAIDICFAADNNYAIPMCVAVASILKNSGIEQYNIYILDGGISLENKKHFGELQNIKKFYYEYIKVDQDEFEQCPMTQDGAHITRPTYYRFKLPSYFPDKNKILYLDCDILAIRDIKDLWTIDISNYYAGVVKDIYSTVDAKRLHINNYYFNAGVMLINLDKWRKDNIEAQLFNYAINKKEIIKWQDQDVLNVVLSEKLLLLDDVWNFQYSYVYNIKDSEQPHYYSYPPDNIGIIHFIGIVKPWDRYSKLSNKKLYYQYFKLTSYKRSIKNILPNTKIIKQLIKKSIVKVFRITGTERYARKLWDYIKNMNK